MITVRTPQTPQEWELYYDLRYRILREPLGKERGSEHNEGDATGIHFSLYDNEQLVGIARLDRVDTTTCQVRFVAIESAKQGKGYGKQLMLAVENAGKTTGYTKMVLHARDYALPFYLGLGYENHGASYKLFDVLQHYEMSKPL